MTMTERKSKMVSFRLSPEEYRQLRDACSAHGVRSVSELARSAMQGLISNHGSAIPLHLQLQHLRDRVTLLSCEIDRLSHELQPRQTAAAGL
jgi:hypothetical protein